MSQSGQDRGVRDLFGSDAVAYDARQYDAGCRTYIADRQTLVLNIFRNLGLPESAKVLDVACGPGRFLEAAHGMGHVVFGVDSSFDMLRASSARISEGARLSVGDATALPYASCTFDAVNCSGLIEYLPQPVPMLKELLRVLKPGHKAVVSSTNRLSPALVLEPVIDAVRGSKAAKNAVRTLRLPFDEMALRKREFRLTFHTPRVFSSLMLEAGFVNPKMHFHHLQLLPHPLDRLAPKAATACVSLTDRLLRVSAARQFAEGLIAVATRDAGFSD